MASEVTLTPDNFDEEVRKSDIPVLVDFWADWCVPCKMVAPILEEISDEYQGKLKVGKFNVDQGTDVASKYNVVSIPTMILFKSGEVTAQKVGAGSKDDIVTLFSDHL
ncbi:MAG: thioredoxin [Spirochaetota bacterium]